MTHDLNKKILLNTIAGICYIKKYSTLVVYCLILSFFLTACGSGSDNSGGGNASPAETISLPTASLSGRVEFPSGTKDTAGSFSQLNILNSLGSATPSDDGTFELRVFSAGPQYVSVVRVNDDTPVLLGFIDSTNSLINARSTARVLAWFASGCYLLTPDLQTKALPLLLTTPELDDVEYAVVDALKTGDSNPFEAPAVISAVSAFAEAMTSNTKSVSPFKQMITKGTLVTPSAKRSGITILNLDGLNNIQIQNEYRRRNQVFISRTSYVPGSGGDSVESVEPLTDFLGPQPSGVGGTVSSFVDLFLNTPDKWAYTAQVSKPVELPLYPEDAQSTCYKVAIVGTGTRLSEDMLKLTPEETTAMVNVSREGVIYDFLLPIALNMVLPIHEDQVKTLFKCEAGLLKDITAIANVQVPSAVAKIEKGDVKGAVIGLTKAFFTPGTFRSAVFKSIQQVITEMSGEAAGLKVEAFAKGVKGIFKVTDFLLTLTDTVIQVGGYADSDLATVWYVDVTPPKIVLDPPSSNIKAYDSVLLSVTFPEGKPGDDVSKELSYEFTCTGTAGVIINSEYLNGPNTFETTKDWVHYVAENGTAGADQVTVNVYRTKDGKKKLLGKATAEITITTLPIDLKLEPDQAQIDLGSSVTISAVTTPVIPAAQASKYVYQWKTTAQAGTLPGNAGQQTTYHDGGSTVVYTAGQTSGSDDVFCELYKIVNSQRVKVGMAMATITVKVPGSGLHWKDPFVDHTSGLGTVRSQAWFVTKPAPSNNGYVITVNPNGHNYTNACNNVSGWKCPSGTFSAPLIIKYPSNSSWVELIRIGKYFGYDVADDEMNLLFGSTLWIHPHPYEGDPNYPWTYKPFTDEQILADYYKTDYLTAWQDWLAIARNWTWTVEVQQ